MSRDSLYVRGVVMAAAPVEPSSTRGNQFGSRSDGAKAPATVGSPVVLNEQDLVFDWNDTFPECDSVLVLECSRSVLRNREIGDFSEHGESIGKIHKNIKNMKFSALGPCFEVMDTRVVVCDWHTRCQYVILVDRFALRQLIVHCDAFPSGQSEEWLVDVKKMTVYLKGLDGPFPFYVIDKKCRMWGNQEWYDFDQLISYEERRPVVLAGPGYSSDVAGDGPSKAWYDGKNANGGNSKKKQPCEPIKICLAKWTPGGCKRADCKFSHSREAAVEAGVLLGLRGTPPPPGFEDKPKDVEPEPIERLRSGVVYYSIPGNYSVWGRLNWFFTFLFYSFACLLKGTLTFARWLFLVAGVFALVIGVNRAYSVLYIPSWIPFVDQCIGVEVPYTLIGVVWLLVDLVLWLIDWDPLQEFEGSLDLRIYRPPGMHQDVVNWHRMAGYTHRQEVLYSPRIYRHLMKHCISYTNSDRLVNSLRFECKDFYAKFDKLVVEDSIAMFMNTLQELEIRGKMQPKSVALKVE